MKTLFDADRLSAAEALELTLDSLAHYGAAHRHWAIAWSGGKDSSAHGRSTRWPSGCKRGMTRRSLSLGA